MPVSGRPTNAPLLKITQGSSGPTTNPFQKAEKAAGAASVPTACRRTAFWFEQKESNGRDRGGKQHRTELPAPSATGAAAFFQLRLSRVRAQLAGRTLTGPAARWWNETT